VFPTLYGRVPQETHPSNGSDADGLRPRAPGPTASAAGHAQLEDGNRRPSLRSVPDGPGSISPWAPVIWSHRRCRRSRFTVGAQRETASADRIGAARPVPVLLGLNSAPAGHATPRTGRSPKASSSARRPIPPFGDRHPRHTDTRRRAHVPDVDGFGRPRTSPEAGLQLWPAAHVGAYPAPRELRGAVPLGGSGSPPPDHRRFYSVSGYRRSRRGGEGTQGREPLDKGAPPSRSAIR
jgi:hypothetical protein